MKTKLGSPGVLNWWCPGCARYHGVPIQGDHKWTWNESHDLPTLAPSVLVYKHKATPPFKDQPRCHIFMRDGKIQFLSDCTHALAGQTVEIPEWEE